MRRSQKDLAEVFRIAGEVVTDEQWSQLGKHIQADPEMRALLPPFWR